MTCYLCGRKDAPPIACALEDLEAENAALRAVLAWNAKKIQQLQIVIDRGTAEAPTKNTK